MTDAPQLDDSVPVSHKKLAAKGAVWITFMSAGLQVTSFLVFVAMAHFVEPRDFGLISISQLAIQGVQTFILCNATAVVERKQKGTELEYTTTFWITNGLATFLFFLLLISAESVGRLFNVAGLARVLRAMSVIVLFMGLARTHEVWLARHFHFKPLALRALFGAIVGGAVGLALAVKGGGVMALVGQQVAGSAVSLVFLWLACSWRPSFSFSGQTASEIFRFLRSTIPNGLVSAANQSCDIFLIGFFFGAGNAGLFSVGKRITLALQLITGGPIDGIALPTLAEIQHDPVRLRWRVLHSLRVICVICAPIFLGASAVSYEAVTIVFGHKWIDAAPVLEFLAFSGLAMVIIMYHNYIFILRNRQVWSLYISAAYCILATLAFFICLDIKIKSLALPFVLPYLLVLPLSAILVCKCIEASISEWIEAVLPGIASAIIMFLAVRLAGYWLTGFSDPKRLVLLCAVGMLCYLGVIFSVWRTSSMMAVDMLRHMIK